MSGLGAEAVRAALARFEQAFEAQRTALDELDRQSGDGDFGGNIAGAFERIDASAAETPGAVFGAVANAFMHIGGTSGPLFGMLFARLAKAAGDAPLLATRELAEGVASGLAGIRRLGGAAPGDKTLIDALDPTAAALAGAGDGPVGDALRAAARAARAGAEATAELLARRGRASYVGEAARGVQDPGAVTIALLFEALAEAASNSLA